MVMGIDGSIEGEGHDRVGSSCNGKSIDVLQLPGCQNEFIQQVTALNSKVILVLMNGGPISLTKEVLGDDKIVAIIDTFYPGALGGTAIAPPWRCIFVMWTRPGFATHTHPSHTVHKQLGA